MSVYFHQCKVYGKMRGLRRPTPHKLLVLVVVLCVFVGELGLTINAAQFLKHEEFKRSMARYRHLLQENLEDHEPEKHVDQFQGEEQQVVRHEKDLIDKIPENLSDVKIPNETTPDQQQVEEKPEIERDEKRSDESPNDTTPDQQQVEEKSEIERAEKRGDETPNETTPDQQQVQEKPEIERDEKRSEEIPNGSPAEQQQFEEKHEEERPEEKKSDEAVDESPAQEEPYPPDSPFVQPEHPYVLGPPITDWDQQRARWLDQHPNLKLTAGRSRVLIITGSQPQPCRTEKGDNFHIKALKNKMDYARMHNYEIFYNFAFLDPLFDGVWVKLPIIRKLMLTHPEIEWIQWMDADAIFTDLFFEPPPEIFEGNNLVMWGWKYGIFTERRWLAINDGVFYIRNCQWSLDLIDKWSPMGPADSARSEYGKLLSACFSDRRPQYPADDQSALAYLALTDEEVRSKVKLIEEWEFKMSGYWVDVVDKLEMYAEKYHPGLGDDRWPWITHFTGCAPCGGGNNPQYSYDMCMDNFNRAFHFADNQVLAFMGFQHLSLESSNVVKTRNETDRSVLEWLDVNPWAERIAQVAAAGESEGHTSES